MRMKNYMISIICVCLLMLFTACESESDKRQKRIQELQQEIEELQKKSEIYDTLLEMYDNGWDGVLD